ncbi:MAG: energy transducer TonB [Aeromonadaceae bacterium]
MRKLIICLSAFTSIGLHFGLLALLSDAQAMPKQTAPAGASALSVTFSERSPSVSSPAPAQPQPAKSQITANRATLPMPTTRALPTAARPKVVNPAVVKPKSRSDKVSRPTPAKAPQRPDQQTIDTARPPSQPGAGARIESGLSDSGLSSAKQPAEAAAATYPPRYRGPQPAPDYPRIARRRGLEGTCLIEVLMDTQGDVITLALKQSTGHSVLDQAALAAVKSWKFIAPSGMTGASKALVPVRFKLT